MRGASTPKLMRRLNAVVVLDVLRESEPMSVTELIARTGLSRPTVDAVADDLVRLGWVNEATRNQPRGRPARRLEFRASAGHVMGLDIGEHKVRVAAADLRGGIAAETTEHFDPAMDGGARLDAIRAAIAAVRKDAQLRRNQILGACVGCTGGMDATTGDVLFTSAFPGLDSVNLRSELRRSLGAHVAVENDCNLAVVGERWHGVARDVEDVICVLASERLGAGIVVGGQLVRGHAGTAGEMPFLGAYADESGAEGVAQLVRTLGAEAMGADVDAEAVFAAARAGDPVAVDVIERSLEHAGRGIVIMALVLNPELVVIGGGIADAGDAVLDPLRRQLAQMVRLPPRLEASALGERGVLIGAIRRALDHVEDGLLDGLQEAA